MSWYLCLETAIGSCYVTGVSNMAYGSIFKDAAHAHYSTVLMGSR